MTPDDSHPSTVLLVTRPIDSARRLASELRAKGIQALAWPAFDLLPPEDPNAIAQAVQALNHIDAVVFVSPAAVHAFAAELKRQGKRTDHAAVRLPIHVTHWPSNCRIGVVGTGTRDAVLASLPGVEADNIIQPLGDGADQGGSEALIRAWPRHGSLPRQVLLVRAQKGREKLSDWFARQGAIVIDLVAYVRQEHVPSEADWSRLRRAMDAGASLAVLYTSSEAVGVLSHQFESAPPSCALLASARSLCIHERIQDRLHQAGILDTRICGLQADAIAEALAFQALPDTVPLQDTQPPVPPLDIEL